MIGSIVGGIIGGKKQSKAAKQQAALIAKATNEGINDYRAARDYTTEAFAPFAVNAGDDFNTLRTGILGGEYDPRNYDFQVDPGYQFRLSEGMNALDRSAAARGNLLSGSQMKAGQRYAQDFASNEYNRGYNRNANALAAVLGQMGSLVDTGMAARGTQANAVGNYAQGASGLRMAGAQGQGNALMNAANAKANMWSSIGGGFDSLLGSAAGAFGGFTGGSGAVGGASNPLPGGNFQSWY